MPRKRLTSTMRQEQILDTTLEIIAEKGLAGVNTSEIAQRIGIVPSALYRHFENKDALIDALLDRTHSILFENVRKISMESSGASKNLRSLFMLNIEEIRKNEGMQKIVFTDAGVLGNKKKKKKVIFIVRNYMNKLKEIAEKGIREGDLMNDISSEAVAFSMVSFAQHVGLISNLSDGKIDMSNLAELAWSYIERAIRKDNENDGR